MTHLTKYQTKLLDRARKSPIVVTRSARAEAEMWACDGRKVNPDTVKVLLAKGLLVASGDALLEGDTQTYIAK